MRVLLFVLLCGSALAQGLEERLDKAVGLLASSDYRRRAEGKRLVERLWGEHAGPRLLRLIADRWRRGRGDVKSALEHFLNRYAPQIAAVQYGEKVQWLAKHPFITRLILNLEKPNKKWLAQQMEVTRSGGRKAVHILLLRYPHLRCLWQAVGQWEIEYDTFLPRLPNIFALMPLDILGDIPYYEVCFYSALRLIVNRLMKEGDTVALARCAHFCRRTHDSALIRDYFTRFLERLKRFDPKGGGAAAVLDALLRVPKPLLPDALGATLSLLRRGIPEKQEKSAFETMCLLLQAMERIPQRFKEEVYGVVRRFAAKYGLDGDVIEAALYFEPDRRADIIRKALQRSKAPNWNPSEPWGLVDFVVDDTELPLDLAADVVATLLRHPLVFQVCDIAKLVSFMRRLAASGAQEHSRRIEEAISVAANSLALNAPLFPVRDILLLLDSGVLSAPMREKLLKLLEESVRRGEFDDAIFLARGVPKRLRRLAASFATPQIAPYDEAQTMLDMQAQQKRFNPQDLKALPLALMSPATVNKILLNQIWGKKRKWFSGFALGGDEKLWLAAVISSVVAAKGSVLRSSWLTKACRMLAIRTKGKGWRRFFATFFKVLSEHRGAVGTLCVEDFFREMMSTPYGKRLLRDAWRAYVDNLGETPSASYIAAGLLFSYTEYKSNLAELLAWLLSRNRHCRDAVLAALTCSDWWGYLQPSPSVRRLSAALQRLASDPVYTALAVRAHDSALSGVTPLSVRLGLPPVGGEALDSFSHDVVMKLLHNAADAVKRCPVSSNTRTLLAIVEHLYWQCGLDDVRDEVCDTIMRALKRLPPLNEGEKREVLVSLFQIAYMLGHRLASDVAIKLIEILCRQNLSHYLVPPHLVAPFIECAKRIPPSLIIKLAAMEPHLIPKLYLHPSTPKDIRDMLLKRMMFDWELVRDCSADEAFSVMEDISKVAAGKGQDALTAFFALCGLIRWNPLRKEQQEALCRFLLARVSSLNNPIAEELLLTSAFSAGSDTTWSMLRSFTDWLSGLAGEHIQRMVRTWRDTVRWFRDVGGTPCDPASLLLCREALLRGDMSLRRLAFSILSGFNKGIYAEEALPRVYAGKGEEFVYQEGVPHWMVRAVAQARALLAEALQKEREPMWVRTGLEALFVISQGQEFLLEPTLCALMKRGKDVMRAVLEVLAKHDLPPLSAKTALALAEEAEGALQEGIKEAATVLGKLVEYLPLRAAEHALSVLFDACRDCRVAADAANAFIAALLDRITSEKLLKWALPRAKALLHHPPNLVLPEIPDDSNPRCRQLALKSAIVLFNATKPSPPYDAVRRQLLFRILRLRPEKLPKNIADCLPLLLFQTDQDGYPCAFRHIYSAGLLPVVLRVFPRRFINEIFIYTLIFSYDDTSEVVKMFFEADSLPQKFSDLLSVVTTER